MRITYFTFNKRKKNTALGDFNSTLYYSDSFITMGYLIQYQ